MSTDQMMLAHLSRNEKVLFDYNSISITNSTWQITREASRQITFPIGWVMNTVGSG